MLRRVLLLLRVSMLLWASLFILLPTLDGFLLTPQQRLRPQYSDATQRRKPLLYMSNVTLPAESATKNNNYESPFEPLWNALSSFTTSSAYRTVLLTGALFSSRSVREFLGVPGLLAIVTASFAIYYYDTKFNYLVDVVTPKRQAALKELRKYKTQQLSGRTTAATDDFSDDLLPALLKAYENILREELETRVIVPPNLWVIEMDPTQEDRSAAPQLLGLKITDQYKLEPISAKE